MIEKVIDKEGNNPTYLDTYAWVLFKNGNHEKALEVIEKVILLNNKPSGEVLEHYGDILFMNNKPDLAREKWKMARDAGGASKEIELKIENGIK